MTIKNKTLPVTEEKCIFPLTNLRGEYVCTIEYSGDSHYMGATEDNYHLKLTPTTKTVNMKDNGEWDIQYCADATNPVDPTFGSTIKSGVFSEVIHKIKTRVNSRYVCEITVKQEGANQGFILGFFGSKQVDDNIVWTYTWGIESDELGTHFTSNESQESIHDIEELFPQGVQTRVIFDILAVNEGDDCYVSISIGNTTFENIVQFDEPEDLRFGFMSTAPEDKQLVIHSLEYTEWDAEE